SVVLSAALRQWVKSDVVGSHLDDHHKMITTELLVGSAFALALGLLHDRDKALARSAALRPLMVCGQMCYSLYLVHWPVTKPVVTALYLLGVRGVWPTLLVSVPVAVACAVGSAWVFHVWVERPFLNTNTATREGAGAGAIGLRSVSGLRPEEVTGATSTGT